MRGGGDSDGFAAVQGESYPIPRRALKTARDCRDFGIHGVPGTGAAT